MTEFFFSPTIITNCKSRLYNFFKRRLKMLISNDSRAVSRGEISDKQEKATDSWKQVATNAFQQPGQFQKRNIIFCLSMRSLLMWIATTSDIYVYHELLTTTYFTTYTRTILKHFFKKLIASLNNKFNDDDNNNFKFDKNLKIGT